jgi:putative transcriptional regulator
VTNRLKVLRAERDWTQAQLAGHLDVSRQTVNAIETGKYDPSLPLAFRIARLFDLPIEAIFQPDGRAPDHQQVARFDRATAGAAGIVPHDDTVPQEEKTS